MHHAAEHEGHFYLRLVAKRATSGQATGPLSAVSQENHELGVVKRHAKASPLVESDRRRM